MRRLMASGEARNRSSMLCGASLISSFSSWAKTAVLVDGVEAVIHGAVDVVLDVEPHQVVSGWE